VAITTAITTFAYPFIVGSANTVASILERRSPALFRQYVASLSDWLISLRATLSVEGDFAGRIRRSGKVIVVNFGIIVVFITVGTFALGIGPELAESVGLQPSVLGLVLSGVVVVLCIPPSVFIWRALQSLTDDLSGTLLAGGSRSSRAMGKSNIHMVLRDSILVIMGVLVAIWSLPFISQLLMLGSFAAPVPILMLIGLVALTWRAAFKIHRAMESTFSETFLGGVAPTPAAEDDG
jgi:hypothetical protein